MTWWRALVDVVRGPQRWRGGSRPAPAASAPAHRALADYAGPVVPQYAPDLDGDPDPGEVVWTWVPFEEDPARGKDRPVLLIGHDGPLLLGLMLTSKDHVAGATARQQDREGVAQWMDVGAGPWDARRRPSEVRLDRVLRVDPTTVRREGAVLSRPMFEQVTRAMAALRG